MKITVSELRAFLEDMEEDGAGEFEIRIATQSNYPLQGNLENYCYSARRKMVYLAGNGTDYGTGAEWETDRGYNMDEYEDPEDYDD